MGSRNWAPYGGICVLLAYAHVCVCVQSCVSVFKSLSVLEKSVDKCKISMQPDEERLVFQLYCHHGNVFKCFFALHILIVYGFNMRCVQFLKRHVFGRPFVKQFALCYRTIVCVSVCLVTLVYCDQTVGWIEMPLGTQVGLGLAQATSC